MRQLKLLSFLILSFCISLISNAQSTETFETETIGSASFTDNSQVFNITAQARGPFDVYNYSSGGWSGSSPDNRFIDNSGSTGTNPQFTISSNGAIPFVLNYFYLFVSNASLNQAVSGSITITGKLAGATVYTATQSTGFVSSLGTNNGFTLINLTSFGTQNNSNKNIDQIVITGSGSFEYLALDAFNWSTACPTLTLNLASQTNVSCNGGINGSATVSASGGSSFTYTWSPSGGNTATASNFSAGTYTCNATNQCGSTASRTVAITQPASALSTSTAVTNVLCFGNSTGSATITASGGTSPYSYLWSTAQTTSVITGLNAGVRTVTVTDANGCTSIKSTTISQPASALATSTAVSNVLCFGNSTGSATVTVSGGAGSYTYLWSSAQTTSVITGLNAGVRTVTVTDANGCTSIKSTNISQPVSSLATSTAVSNVLCFGNATGATTVTATGGTSPYTYLWSGAQTTSVTSGQTAGVRTVTVTDANACASINTVTISQPASAIATSTAVTNVLCFGNSTGATTVAATGGTSPYTYLWSGAQTTSVTSGQTAGVRTVTVTDANACVSTNTVAISQPASALATSTAVTNISCFGGSNGSSTLTATGGTSSYTYLWSTGATTSVIISQSLGTKSYTVTDANGCASTGNVVISQPTQISANIGSNPTSCTGNTGSASVTSPAGGAGGYSYSWAPSGGTTSTATALGVGSFTCTITDANSCSITKTVSVITASGPSLTSLSQTNIACFGNSTGAASVNNATGGTTPYTYNWTPGNPTGDGTTSVSGLTAQVYTCTVTDANGCSAFQTFNITQTISALATSTAVTNVACFGNSTGAATVTASGGTSAYTYLWSTGATTSVIASQTSGVKTVTVTDANGCTSIKSVSISQPVSALATSTAVTNVACFGNSTGAATITATGGTTAYSYLWSTGATTSVIASQTSGVKTVTVTDANGCTSVKSVSISQPATALVTATAVTNVLCSGNATGSATITATGGTTAYSYLWSTGATTSVIVSQTSGVKTVTVTDANGCTSVNSVNISQPTLLTATSSQTNTTCNGACNGAANVSVSGGTSPYSYNWSNGSTTTSQNGLCAGSYTVTITDANGCTLIQTITITEPTAITVSATSGNILCNGGSTTVTVTANGGTGAFTGTGTFTQTAGSYTYTVADSNGCSATTSITVSEPTVLTVNLSAAPIACNGSTTQVNFVANGGTSPYTGTSPVTVSAGSYSYTVTDNNGCAVTETISISQPAAIVASQTITLCNGQSLTIGANTYTASGIYVDVLPSQVNGCDSTLTTNLTISSAITHTQSITLCFGETINVGANTYNTSGTYVDVLTSGNGCDSTLTTILVVNPAIDVTTNLSGLTISANASSATYQWIDCDNSNQPIAGETNQSFTASSNGNYAVIVTQNACSDTSACVNISTVGIKDMAKLNAVNFYPNPSNGIYNISGLAINSKIVVYDAIGQIIYTSITTEAKETVDISKLPNGVYVIQLNSENSTITKKVIKKD